MKPMSKLFLIVSGIITAIGGILMVIGLCSASSAGIQLFPEKTDGKYVYTLDLTDTEISKISIDATDADITVYTGCDKEYVEFINFNENYYSVSTTNRVLSFDEYVDLESVFSFWTSDFKFKGVRSLFSLGKTIEGDKKINIYISSARDLNVFDFEIEEGNISIANLSTSTDYKFTVGTGKVKLHEIVSTSSFSLSGNSCTLEIEECEFQSFTVDVAEITMKGDIDKLHSFVLNSKSGVVNTELALDGKMSYVTAVTSGSALINGESVEVPYKNIAEPKEITDEYSTVSVTGETLNIVINFKDKTSDSESTEETE